MRLQRLSIHMLSMLALAGLSGCGTLEEGDAALGQTDQDLYAGNVTFWNSARGQPATVPVCWTVQAANNQDWEGKALPAGHPGFNFVRDKVRLGVENTWGRVANITFTGWNNLCTVSPTGDDRVANPNTIMFTFFPGDYSDFVGRRDDMGTMIRISMYDFGEAGLYTNAIHEVGHALGYEHEHQRPDNWNNGIPTTCLRTDGQQPIGGGTYDNVDVWGQTFVDSQSVMCYDTAQRAFRLSAGDVMGIQRRYGRKPSGSIVGLNGHCAGTSWASVLSANDCNSSSAGTWNFYHYSNGANAIQSRTTTSQCWNTNSSYYLVQSACSSTSRFRFPPSNMRWRAIGNTCVTASSASTGASVSINSCGVNPLERWDFLAPSASSGSAEKGQIRLTNTNLCVTAPNTTPNLGDALTLANCASGGSTRQNFQLVKNAQNISYGNLCVNVSGGFPNVGAPLTLWDSCGDPNAQNLQFNLSGSLVSQSRCTTVANEVGSSMYTTTCAAAPTPDAVGYARPDPQEWDLYW